MQKKISKNRYLDLYCNYLKSFTLLFLERDIGIQSVSFRDIDMPQVVKNLPPGIKKPTFPLQIIYANTNKKK